MQEPTIWPSGEVQPEKVKVGDIYVCSPNERFPVWIATKLDNPSPSGMNWTWTPIGATHDDKPINRTIWPKVRI